MSKGKELTTDRKEQLKLYAVQLEQYVANLRAYIGTTPSGPHPKNPPRLPK